MLTRLYLVPERNQPQRILDVPDGELVLDKDGQYRSPSTVQYVTLQNQGSTYQSSDFIKVCWREHLNEAPVNPEPVVATDPTGGVCICLLTCSGHQVPVQTVAIQI